MSVEFYRGSPGKFDSRTLSRETLSRWTGRIVSLCYNIVYNTTLHYSILYDLIVYDSMLANADAIAK